MKWTIATTRSRIPHHENAKNKNDPIVKSHYSKRLNAISRPPDQHRQRHKRTKQREMRTTRA